MADKQAKLQENIVARTGSRHTSTRHKVIGSHYKRAELRLLELLHERLERILGYAEGALIPDLGVAELLKVTLYCMGVAQPLSG